MEPISSPTAIGNFILPNVKIDLSMDPHEAIRVTGRRGYIGQAIYSAPRGSSSEVDMYFFSVGCRISHKDLLEKYEALGLVPADPFALAAANQAYPKFADNHPNATQWIGDNSKIYIAVFNSWYAGSGVYESRSGVFSDKWWFAGVSKSA